LRKLKPNLFILLFVFYCSIILDIAQSVIDVEILDIAQTGEAKLWPHAFVPWPVVLLLYDFG
jgi:hypothetical protein